MSERRWRRFCGRWKTRPSPLAPLPLRGRGEMPFVDSPLPPPMMRGNEAARREARGSRPYTRSLAGDICPARRPTYRPQRGAKADLSAGARRAWAEGATAPETLRQKDREGDELLESGATLAASTEGVTPRNPPGEISQVR